MAVDMMSNVKAKQIKRAVNRIPLDIVIEILSRLPARSLVRFRRVCKLWQSITHDPRFIDTHVERARNAILLFEESWVTKWSYGISILDNTGSTKRVLWRSSSPIGGRFRVSGSCNGLLCIYGTDGSIEVMNPATGESLILAEPTKALNVAFLGFHPSTKDYKVIRFYQGPKGEIVCEVYTLRTTSWRQICCPHDFFPLTLGATVKGAMYWANWDHTVISFDLKDEIFTLISLPNFKIYQGVNYSVHENLVELQGSVCMSVFRGYMVGQMDIWMLSTKHEWTRKYSITLNFDDPYPCPLLIDNNKILVHKDNDKPMTLLLYHHLNSNNKSEEVYRDNNHSEAFLHVESLVALQNRS